MSVVDGPHATHALAPALLSGLWKRIDELLADRHRVLLGVVGLPGVGKSTLAEALTLTAREHAVSVALVSMDGFHLADRQLDRLGRRGRKGAVDTFDGHGYLALLRRLADEPDHTVYAPLFEREREEPLAGAVAVPPQTRLVVTEGNYLLDESEPWNAVRDVLTEVWFCDVDDALRRERLIARHVRFGKPEAAARRWVSTVDDVNAARVASTRSRADRLVRL